MLPFKNAASIVSVSRSRLLALSAVLGLGLTAACMTRSYHQDEQGGDAQRLEGAQLTGRTLPPKTVALTFDDGPGLGTKAFAKWLKDNNVPSTFFVVGRLARDNKSALEAIRENGHLVANHSFSHPINPPFAQLSAARRLAEIVDTHRVIKDFITGDMLLYRSPGGSWSGNSATIADIPELAHYVGPVHWDVGGEMKNGYAADWACWPKSSRETCAAGYLKEINDQNGGIVLLHDIHADTIAMVKEILVPRLKAQGYTFVRLDKVPNIAAKLKENGGRPGAGSGGAAPPPVTIPEPACTVPPLQKINAQNQTFRINHGQGENKKFHASLVTIPGKPSKRDDLTHKFDVTHNATDKSNIGFKLDAADGSKISGIRYNLSFAPGDVVEFSAQWKCFRYEGRFTYKSGATEELDIEPVN